MDHENRVHHGSIEPGEPVYDSDGQLLGRVSGLTENGFEAETVGPNETEEEVVPGQEFGEGYLMWRCGECGEMDRIKDGIPESCPACGAPREAIAEVVED